jgi:tetratricopeptide (TPR) repeat protein
MPSAPAQSLNEAVARASDILGRDPRAALGQARAILSAAPNDPRARLILASAHRRLGETNEALAILRPLARAFPAAAHTQYELGMALAAKGDRVGAVEALRRAVAARRDLADAWAALGEILFSQGDTAGAERAFGEQERANIRDPALIPPADALLAGDPARAEALLRPRLLVRPDDAGALRLMAEALARQGRFADAETLLKHALRLKPDDHGLRFSLASALFNQQKAPEALPHVEQLLALDPRSAAYRNLMAACLGLVGEFDRAIALNAELVAQFPRQPRVWLNHGHALRTVGRVENAVDAYRRAIGLAPGLGDAWWSLANLKVARLSAADQAMIQSQIARPDLSEDDRLHLHYALGKALEDAGEHAGAFEHYAKGARLRRALVPYDPTLEAGLAQRSIALFTRAFFAARPEGGSPREDPVFIVGLPRSGSTLVEQILASHSAVEGVMELPDIGIIAEELSVSRGVAASQAYPQILADLAPAERTRLGDLYLARTQVHRKTGRPLFIDKMPNNFRHLGLIRLILPKAKVIDARRHPLAVGFSAFKQHFNQGQAFSYDLADIGAYYRDYVAVMAALDEALPGWICRMIYEDLVEDLETQVRRLLDHCGLPFEEGCLRFHENDRAVRTVSSEQVRRPIFREGLEQWRRYEPWLTPLKTALGPALEGWR